MEARSLDLSDPTSITPLASLANVTSPHLPHSSGSVLLRSPDSTTELPRQGTPEPEYDVNGEPLLTQQQQRLELLRYIEIRNRRYNISLDMVERYHRYGFVTAPGDAVPSFL
eukprot:GHVN01047861.1.p1 GENE.GHVN01047861.1~~GHVN01047861.1.p1  ORF type:complete len:120 (+),score=34.54 GHVN01047861.1:25-360(+)